MTSQVKDLLHSGAELTDRARRAASYLRWGTEDGD